MSLWSSRKLVALLGMTVHFVTPEPQAKLESHLLAFKRSPERHKAANILAAYEETIEEYELEGKVSVLVTDSAANMLAAFKFSLASGSEQPSGSGTRASQA
ncbi:hypothetical protein FJT64_009911 [Amphibalanus amphitrite]|uniref:Uncharacterized protein n=1 Tax=Amphibalanus amphitrite TaxID=1232801 RepID=A0A6A4VFU2_AMPAM|nr:hypothetical protein FJT64_009911 [Amphibalanus amphitrite]